MFKPGTSDNLMQNMALNVNAYEHERQREVMQLPSKAGQKAGKIAFWVLLAVVCVAVACYIAMHL